MVAKALKLAGDMRALAVKEDHWYNHIKASDVNEVVDKYGSMIQAARASKQRGLAEEMLAALFDTPTGEYLFWDQRKNYGSYYNCRERVFIDENTYLDNSYLRKEYGVDWEINFDDDMICSDGGEMTICTVLGTVTKTRAIHECHWRNRR